MNEKHLTRYNKVVSQHGNRLFQQINKLHNTLVNSHPMYKWWETWLNAHICSKCLAAQLLVFVDFLPELIKS